MTPAKPQDTLFAKTAGGVFWTGLGSGGQTVIQFVVLIVLARLLTPEDFGIVAAAMVVVGLSTIFSLVGVGPAVVQRRNLETRHIRTAFTISLILGIFFYGVVWAISPQVEIYFRMAGLTEVLRLVALVFPIKGLGVVSDSLAQRELKFKFLSGVTIISFLLGYGAVGIYLAIAGLGPYALVGAYIGQASIMSILLLVGRSHKFIPTLDFNAFRELMYFGTGYTMAQIGKYWAGQGDSLVVGRVMGAAGLGVYGRAHQLMMIPVILIGRILYKVLFASMASLQEDKNRLMEAYRRGLAVVAIVILPLSVFMIVFADSIVMLVLGKNWSEVVVPLQILAAALLFRNGYIISDTLAKAAGAVYRQMWRHWVYALAVIVFAAIGSMWGVQGVAFGVTFAIILNYTLMAILSCRITSLSLMSFVRAQTPGLTLGVTCLGSALIIKKLLIPDLGPIAVMVVAAVVILFLVILLWRLFPRVFLGRDGEWFLSRLGSVFPLIKKIRGESE